MAQQGTGDKLSAFSPWSLYNGGKSVNSTKLSSGLYTHFVAHVPALTAMDLRIFNVSSDRKHKGKESNVPHLSGTSAYLHPRRICFFPNAARNHGLWAH